MNRCAALLLMLLGSAFLLIGPAAAATVGSGAAAAQAASAPAHYIPASQTSSATKQEDEQTYSSGAGLFSPLSASLRRAEELLNTEGPLRFYSLLQGESGESGESGKRGGDSSDGSHSSVSAGSKAPGTDGQNSAATNPAVKGATGNQAAHRQAGSAGTGAAAASRNLPVPASAVPALVAAGDQSKSAAAKLYRELAGRELPAGGCAPAPALSEHLKALSTLGSLLLSEPLQAALSLTAEGESAVRIPLLLMGDKKLRANYYRPFYTEGKCQGLGVLEAALKGQCATEGRTVGLVELMLPTSGPGSALYTQRPQLLPENEASYDPAYDLWRGLASLLGLASHSDAQGFNAPLTTFDKKLYALNLKGPVTAKTKFSSLGEGCSLQQGERCLLYFQGEHTKELLTQSGVQPQAAAAAAAASEGGDKAKAKAQADAAALPEGLLPISFAEAGRPCIARGRGLLSCTDYSNVGFYDALELRVLQDLGYALYPEQFGGDNYYQSGTFTSRLSFETAHGFTAYDKEKSEYKKNRYSELPLTVGTGLYGRYLKVTQTLPVMSTGYASVGARLDGAENTYTVPEGSRILVQGSHGSGIAVSYGRDHVLNLHGEVSAGGPGGVGVRAAFGSNLRSDALEYRGSYLRVRSDDFKAGKLSKSKAQAPLLPYDLQGPLIKRLNLTGQISGTQAALLIEPTAHVQEVNLSSHAEVNGAILSYWQPYFEQGNLYVRPYASEEILPGQLQTRHVGPLTKLEAQHLLEGELATTINLGLSLDEEGEHKRAGAELMSDPKSAVTIQGEVSGPTLILRSLGGRSELTGVLRIQKLVVADSLFKLNTPLFRSSHVEALELGNDGLLDLVNGSGNYLKVERRAYISSSAALRLDCDEQGRILDKLIFAGNLYVPSGQITVEPGLSYANFKRFTSDPRAMKTFIRSFLSEARRQFNRYGVSVRFPKHVWYSQGNLGREIRCSARGCYARSFVGSSGVRQLNIPTWRLALNSVCAALAVLAFWWIRKILRRRRHQSHGG
ncbi:MAG: hypothetical protein IJ228_14035 [Succinivibrio sp.]|nr:hypothetical protein [Succinivibrio sp.]